MKKIFISYTVEAEIDADKFKMRHIESGSVKFYSEIPENELSDYIADNLQEAAEEAEDSSFDSHYYEV